MMNMTLSRRNKLWVLLWLAILAHTPQVLASDGNPRLGNAASAAFGIGFEVSYGAYGAGADATLVALPLSVYLYPTNEWDITIEAPLLFLSSKSESGMVLTRSGGAGRGRGADRTITTVTAGTTTAQESGLGDISITAGRSFFAAGDSTIKIRSTIYLKIPSGDLSRGLGTGTVEAGQGLSVSRWLGNVQLFGEGAYIFQNSNSNYPGRNYVSYLGGAGIQATERSFVSVLAKGSSSRSDGAEAPAEGRLKLNYMHSRRISWEIYGSTGFTNASPAYGGGMMMIYRF